jgi:hypothetical protein
MVEKVITQVRNVIDFASFRQGRNVAGRAQAISARTCRHCGAVLSDDEREEECSSIDSAVESLRWQAAQILGGLI